MMMSVKWALTTAPTRRSVKMKLDSSDVYVKKDLNSDLMALVMVGVMKLFPCQILSFICIYV